MNAPETFDKAIAQPDKTRETTQTLSEFILRERKDCAAPAKTSQVLCPYCLSYSGYEYALELIPAGVLHCRHCNSSFPTVDSLIEAYAYELREQRATNIDYEKKEQAWHETEDEMREICEFVGSLVDNLDEVRASILNFQHDHNIRR